MLAILNASYFVSQSSCNSQVFNVLGVQWPSSFEAVQEVVGTLGTGGEVLLWVFPVTLVLLLCCIGNVGLL